MMLKKFLLHINKRTWRFAAVGILLLLIIVLFPFPMSVKRLSSTRWCAPSIQDAHFQFDQEGEFHYGAVVVDSVGDASSIDGQGRWEGRGTSFHVVVDDGNIHDKGYSFTLRPMLLGYAFWSTVDFGEAIILLPIWQPC